MATMEPANNPATPGRRRRKNRKVYFSAPQDGYFLPGVTAAKGGSGELDIGFITQRLSTLHMACLYGQLASLQLLEVPTPQQLNSSDSQGRRPIHMVMSSRSSPNAAACLGYLLESGADIHVTTDSGQTALHLAAAGGLLDCAQMLVQAGADVMARDGMGLTPLFYARVWCRRDVARYLRSCMWKVEKKKEVKEKQRAEELYGQLLSMAKLPDIEKEILEEEKLAEWAMKKGLPPLKDFSSRVLGSTRHLGCLLFDPDGPENPFRKPDKDPKKKKKKKKKKSPRDLPVMTDSQQTPRLWSVYADPILTEPSAEPDLRDSVKLWKDSRGRPWYSTKWDDTPRSGPDLPLDVLQKVLFPRSVRNRIDSPRDFGRQDIWVVQRRGSPLEKSASPWTEVAMHLVEKLEPGHY